jgi:hypothetical protein
MTTTYSDLRGLRGYFANAYMCAGARAHVRARHEPDFRQYENNPRNPANPATPPRQREQP